MTDISCDLNNGSDYIMYIVVNEAILKNIKEADIPILNVEELCIRRMLSEGIYPFRITINYANLPIELGKEILCYTKDSKGCYYGTKNKTVNL